MDIIYPSVKMFAGESKNLHDAMKEYAQNCINERKGLTAFQSRPKEDMEKLIDKAFVAELGRKSKEYLPENATKHETRAYASHPTVAHFANQIKDVMVDMVLPMSLVNGPLKYFAEFRYADLGDTITFNLENNSLYTITEAGYRKNHTNLQKLFKSTDTISSVNHQITVGTDLYEILTGFTSMAREVMKVALSIETIMYYEAYDLFRAQMVSLGGNLEVTNYSSPSLLKLCQTIEAWNYGAKPVILGTPVALNGVLPTVGNPRTLLDSDYVKTGYLHEFQGYDIVPLGQSADILNPNPYSLKLSDQEIYVVSPGSQKLVQIGLFGGTYTYQEAPHTNANELIRNTTSKAWGMKVITNAVAGVVKNLG